MLNRLIILLIGIAFVGCSDANEDMYKASVNDTNDVKEVEVDTIIEKEVKGIVIPYIGEFNLEEMSLDSVHKYGGGDCEGEIILKSYSHVALGIDSSWCGEWGFEFTNYVMTKEGALTAIHFFEYYIESEDSVKRNYVLKERVFDFNTEPLTVYWRKKDVEKEKEFADEEFLNLTIDNRDSVYSYWNEKLKKTWAMEFDF